MPFSLWGNTAVWPDSQLTEVPSTPAHDRRSPDPATDTLDVSQASEEEEPGGDVSFASANSTSSPPCATSTQSTNEGSFRSSFQLKPSTLQHCRSPVAFSGDAQPPVSLTSLQQGTRTVMVVEPPPEASPDEVKAAYLAATAELQKLEAELPTCSTPDRKRKKLSLQLLQGVTQRLLTRHLHTSSFGELDAKVSRLADRHDELVDTVETVKEMALRAEGLAKKIGGDNGELRDEVDFLQAGYEHLRKVIEQLDQKQRKKNVIIIGATRGEPFAVVRNLLAGKADLLANLDEAFFLGKGNGRRPLLVSFTKVTSAEDCLRHSHTSSFVSKFPNIKMVRDRSDLRRTGTSRLAAAAPELKRRFPGIMVHKHHDYVEFGNRRFDAFDFAASAADILGVLFDVEDACMKNPDYEVAEGVFVRVGDVVIFGYRKKQVAGLVFGLDQSNAAGAVGSGAVGSDNFGGVGGVGGSHDVRPTTAKGRGKRSLAGTDAFTAGGVRMFDGSNRFHGQNRNLLVMGALDDPFEDRQTVKRKKRKDSLRDPTDLSMEIDPEAEHQDSIDSDRARRYKIRELYRKTQE